MYLGTRLTDDTEVFGKTMPDERASAINQQPQFLVYHFQGRERVGRAMGVQIAD